MKGKQDKVEDFLIENKVSFNQMIKCFNFLGSLTQSERLKFIDTYQQHKYDNIGWYWFVETKHIETLSKWLVLKQMIKDKGYTLWQMQYDWDNPDGYHVGYMNGDKRLEVITHCKDVADDINKDLWRRVELWWQNLKTNTIWQKTK